MLHVTVYRGTSVNASNSVRSASEWIGRFAPSVDVGSLIIDRADTGEFFYHFPRLCSCGHYETEEEATQAAQDWLTHNRDGWTTDRPSAEAAAVAAARERHEEKCRQSENYRRTYAV